MSDTTATPAPSSEVSRAVANTTQGLARAIIEQARATVRHDKAVRERLPQDEMWNSAQARREAERITADAVEQAVRAQMKALTQEPSSP